MKSHTTKIFGVILLLLGLFVGYISCQVLYQNYKEHLRVGDILITDKDAYGYDEYDFDNPFIKTPVVGTDTYKIIVVKNGYCLYEHTEIQCEYKRKYIIEHGDTVDFEVLPDSIFVSVDTNSAECRDIKDKYHIVPTHINTKLKMREHTLCRSEYDTPEENAFISLILD